MAFKRIRFEEIPEEAQNNWEVPHEMVKYTKKYFEKYVSDKELKDKITLNSPVPTNLLKAKDMDDYFVELLEDQRQKKEIALDDTFRKLQSKILTIKGPLSKVWYTVEESLAKGYRKFHVDEISQYIDQTILLIGQAFNSVSYNRRMNVLIGVGTEKAKAKNTLKNQASLLKEDSKELFYKSFRKHMVATAKTKKESKEVYRKSRVNNSDKRPFLKSPSLQKQNGERFVSFTTSKFSRGLSTSSSQSSQGFQPPWKSKRPFGKSFLNKEGNLSQHNLISTKNTFSGDRTNASVKTCAAFGTKPFSERGNRKLSTCRKTAVFFRKLENSGKRLKNVRMGIWVKNRLSGGTISTPGSNVNSRVKINQPRGRGNAEKGGHSPSSLKGESISKQLVFISKKG